MSVPPPPWQSRPEAVLYPMGTLRHVISGREVTLDAVTTIGRATGGTLVLDTRRISSQHAMLFHDGSGWFVRDLGSRNGTWLGEARLTTGTRTAVKEGATLRFADDPWILAYAGPPQARAVDGQGKRRLSEGDLLVLPSDETPLVTVYRDANGQWWLESGTARTPTQDGASIEVEGQRWTLALPGRMQTAGMSTTIGTARMPDSLAGLDRLQFAVSRDEESVATTLHYGHAHQILPPRSFHYLCVLLARARLADQADGEPEAEAGWRYTDDVARDLGVDSYRLNVEVYRLRKQLSGLGLRDAATIIERRPQARQLRIGLARVEVS